MSKGDFMLLLVGLDLTITALEVNDYDFELYLESIANIAWVTIESL